MTDKINYINEKIIVSARDSLSISKNFCHQFGADIFGKTRLRRSEYKVKVYTAISSLTRVQESLGKIIKETQELKSALLYRTEKFYSDKKDEEAERMCELISRVEDSETVCLAVSEDCISEYVCSLEASLTEAFSGLEIGDLNVSALKQSSSAFILRTEQYLKKLQ